MTQADCVFITPPTDASRLLNIIEQEAARQASIETLRLLRRQARDEIDKLLAFLDASDTYVTTELEDDGDQADASYSESGVKVCSPMEDDEDSDTAEEDDAPEDGHDREDDCSDYEPSLGWPERMARGVDHGGSQDRELDGRLTAF